MTKARRGARNCDQEGGGPPLTLDEIRAQGAVYELVPLKENRDRRETAQRRCGESRDSHPTTIRQQEEHRDTHGRGSDGTARRGEVDHRCDDGHRSQRQTASGSVTRDDGDAQEKGNP